MRLSGKVAVLTGAGRGIGRAIAIEFAKEGCDCVIADIDLAAASEVAEEIKEFGRWSVAIRADVSKVDDVGVMVDEALEKMEKIDILVNNAGIFGFSNSEDLTEEEWDRTIDINLKGTFLCCKAVFKVFVNHGGGRIINISSANGKFAAPMMIAYNASKAGVILLTKTLAIEWAKYNIAVNAICPGITATDVVKTRWKDQPEAYRQRINRIPLGRVANPEDIAKVAVFLASSDSDYVTGEEIIVDGGTLALHPGYPVPR